MVPTGRPSSSSEPSGNPTLSSQPSGDPSFQPSGVPSTKPSNSPSISLSPSETPSNEPSESPSISFQPSLPPSISFSPTYSGEVFTSDGSSLKLFGVYGIMFEVIPNRAMSIETFHVKGVAVEATYNFQVYTRQGPWDQFSSSSSAGWTKISENDLSISSADAVVKIPMSKITPVTVYAGQTQSFYFASTGSYFIGGEAGMETASTDSAVSLYSGRGIERTLFGQGRNGIRFLGSMIYSYRSDQPSISPSELPTPVASMVPSITPTRLVFPSFAPSITRSDRPSNSAKPTTSPTTRPTSGPTAGNTPSIVFRIPSSISISGFGVPQTQAEIVTVVEIAGPSIAVLVRQNLSENQRVTVNIISINGILVGPDVQGFSARRLVSPRRHLQDDPIDIEYEIVLTEICSTVDCSEKDPQEVSNLLYQSVTSSMQAKIDSGAFATTLETRAAEIGEVIEVAVANSNFEELVIELLALASVWYPSWKTNQHCLNDGKQPFYMMRNSASWLFNNRDSCCTRYYSFDYTACMGVEDSGAIGYYPAWDGTGKCLNDTALPEYMRLNPSQWIYDDIDSCCDRYYNWDAISCRIKSDGATADAATNKWYVNHIDEVCEQDCHESNGGSCGGLVPSWKVLYETSASCCENVLTWISPFICEAASGGMTYSGSEKWYADFSNTKCVQDCANAAHPACGGILTSAFVDLFDTADSCCANRLGWVQSKSCKSSSTNTAISSAGSGDYYVNYRLSRCVKDCVGAAPCGGLANSWDQTFPSAHECCSTKLWWLDVSDCICT
mmetsp:Transcript_31509/g.60108  ORF Transcript_31509/g.60108 Transcript_31509/m.60108 type:complete len:784 (-) Transcript_31509:593-2944(-)